MTSACLKDYLPQSGRCWALVNYRHMEKNAAACLRGDIRPLKGRQTEGDRQDALSEQRRSHVSVSKCSRMVCSEEEEEEDGQKAITSLPPLWTDTGPGRAALIGAGTCGTNEGPPKTQASWCEAISRC